MSDSFDPSALPPNEGVIGEDGWVFLGTKYFHSYNQAIRRYELPPSSLYETLKIIEYMGRFCARRKIAFLFAPAPAKWSIYPDKLPSDARWAVNAPSILDRILETATPADLPVLDLRPALWAARLIADTHSPLDSHWTPFGAWSAWQVIRKELLHRMGAPVRGDTISVSSIDVVDDWNEALQLMNIPGPNRWTRITLDRPLPDYELTLGEGDTTQQAGLRMVDLEDLPARTRCHSANIAKRVFFFRDSTGSQLSPFMQTTFLETRQFDHHITAHPKAVNLPGRVEDHSPDAVVYMAAERYFSEPLGDLSYWHAVDNFECSPEEPDQIWPSRHGLPALEFPDVANLAEPTPLMFAPTTDSRTDRVLRVILTSQGEGKIWVSYTLQGQVYHSLQMVSAGTNLIFVSLPPEVDGEHLWMRREAWSADLQVTEVRLRSVNGGFPAAGTIPVPDGVSHRQGRTTMAPNCVITNASGLLAGAISGEMTRFFGNVTCIDRRSEPAATDRPSGLHPHCHFEMIDVAATEDWVTTFAHVRPEVLIHFTHGSQGSATEQHLERAVDLSIAGTAQMLEAIDRLRHYACRIVLVSSKSVYGDGIWADKNTHHTFFPDQMFMRRRGPLRWEPENMLPLPSEADVTPAQPINLSGAVALTQELMVRDWAAKNGVEVVILRMQSVYGPAQADSSLISRFIKLARAGNPIEVHEDGAMLRDFVFVDDAAAAICQVAKKSRQCPFAIYDIGCGQLRTVGAVAAQVANFFDAPTPSVTHHAAPGQIRHAGCKIDTARRELGWLPIWSPETGIRHTCASSTPISP